MTMINQLILHWLLTLTPLLFHSHISAYVTANKSSHPVSYKVPWKVSVTWLLQCQRKITEDKTEIVVKKMRTVK